jgi:hypothetical protein
MTEDDVIDEILAGLGLGVVILAAVGVPVAPIVGEGIAALKDGLASLRDRLAQETDAAKREELRAKIVEAAQNYAVERWAPP